MEVLFYIILVSQIFLLSYHYPTVIINRYKYIIAHYPAAQYPKFYATDIYVKPEKIILSRLNIFKYMNYFAIVVGIVIIIACIANGFRLNEKGGAEIFVLAYFGLQFIPHMALELYLKKHNKHMRQASTKQKRTAELAPRNLFDFIAPFWVFFAVAIFIVSTFLFIYFEGFDEPWGDDVYISTIGPLVINIGFAFMIFKFVNGSKIDPHQAYKDQLLVIKSLTHNLVFTSIMMSVFFIVINSVREYGLDKWEPILMSVYFQIIVVFGFGQQLRNIKVEEIDFDVYKADPEAKPV